MKALALKSHGKVLIPKLWVADSFLPRFLGLMGKRGLSADEAVFFPKCNSIHTLFMRFSIDVIFVGKNNEVVSVLEKCRPWKWLLPRWDAKHVIEMAGGQSHKLGITKGMILDWGQM
jgi:uncharacterized membrane protein (UPF0127 family)